MSKPPYSVNFYQLTINKKKGFSLIDILLTTLLLVIFTSILLVGSGSFLTSRRTSLQSTAARVASNQLDSLRQIARDDNWNTNLSSSACTIVTTTEYNKLPQRSCVRTVADYNSDPNTKLVTITIRWRENNVQRTITYQTIIYRYGID